MIALVPMHLSPSSSHMVRLAGDLGAALGVEVRVVRPWFDPARAYDGRREQVHSTKVLGLLLSGGPRAADRVLAVSDLDLFIPILTFVFGEAQLDGRAAVISLFRLRPEAYGLPADPDLMASRALKEALHELGHTFGLRHCRHPDCAMRASTYVEDIDLKGAGYCESCAPVVRAGLGA